MLATMTARNVQRQNLARLARENEPRADKTVDPVLYIQAMTRRAEEATSYLEAQGFECVSQNGQRISTNTRLNRDRLDQVKWNEIFIGKLPRDMFEDELLPYLLAPGQVYRIRFMMDFSRTNRGFCFVQYTCVREAIAAIKFLDGRTVVPGRPPIGAKISFDSKCLYFSDLPPWCTEQKLINALEQAEVGGITSARMLGPSLDGLSINQRGGHRNSSSNRRRQPPSKYSGVPYSTQSFLSRNEPRTALVYFETHDSATKARRLLLPGDVKLFNRRIKLDWAKSEIPQHIVNLLHQDQLYTNAADLQALGAVSPSIMPSDQSSNYLRERAQSIATTMSASPTSCDLNNNYLAPNMLLGPSGDNRATADSAKINGNNPLIAYNGFGSKQQVEQNYRHNNPFADLIDVDLNQPPSAMDFINNNNNFSSSGNINNRLANLGNRLDNLIIDSGSWSWPATVLQGSRSPVVL